MASRKLLEGEMAKVSPIAWKSHRLKRKAPSTLSPESQAIGEAAAIAAWFRYLLAEVLHPEKLEAAGSNWELATDQLEYGLITDAKSIYDALSKPTNTAATVQDKRSAIDLAVVRDELKRGKGCIRWIDTNVQLADSLTKMMSPDLLRRVLQTGEYMIREELEALKLKEQERECKKQRRQQSTNTHDVMMMNAVTDAPLFSSLPLSLLLLVI